VSEHPYREKAKHIVIAGAGFGGVYVLKELHKFFHKSRSISITLLNRNNYFLFTPLLHEVATGNIWPENIVEPLRELFPCCITRLRLGRIEEVNLSENFLTTSCGKIQYDYLVLATGATTNFYDIPGASEYSFTLKSLEDAIDLKNHFIHSFERASYSIDKKELQKLLHFIVVGGGPTGVELAAEMSDFFYKTFARFYGKDLIANVSITLVNKDRELLARFPHSLRMRSETLLRKKHIRILSEKKVTKVEKGIAYISDGTELSAGTIIWTAGVRPNLPSFNIKPEADSDGRLLVNENLELLSHPSVFALGDVASVGDGRGGVLPMFAQVASKEAVFVAKNIARRIEGKSLTPLSYTHRGDLVSLGDWMAAGEINGVPLWGHFTWFLWRTVYLSKLISWRKKIQVFVDWTINAFASRDISELYKSEKLKTHT